MPEPVAIPYVRFGWISLLLVLSAGALAHGVAAEAEASLVPGGTFTVSFPVVPPTFYAAKGSGGTS
jgi:hypothetical protein